MVSVYLGDVIALVYEQSVYLGNSKQWVFPIKT